MDQLLQNKQEDCTPDVHFLIGPDNNWCTTALQAIKGLSGVDPHGIVDWRISSGLLRACTPENLDLSLEALHKGDHKTVLHFWVALPSDKWDERSADAQKWLHDRQEISLIPLEFERWSQPVLNALVDPDASSQLPWLLNGRKFPVPKSLLRLARLPGQTDDEARSMHTKGYETFGKWATAFLQDHSNEYLTSVYGPFPDSPNSDAAMANEYENDDSHKTLNNVVNIDSAKSKSTPKYQITTHDRPSVRAAASSALAASSKSGSRLMELATWIIPSRKMTIRAIHDYPNRAEIQLTIREEQPTFLPMQLQLMVNGEPPKLIKLDPATPGKKEVIVSGVTFTNFQAAKVWLEGARIALRFSLEKDGPIAVVVAEPITH